jgi:hypothetical protein
MRRDILGIFLANSFQDVKESLELHAENRGEKRMKRSPASQAGLLFQVLKSICNILVAKRNLERLIS